VVILYQAKGRLWWAEIMLKEGDKAPEFQATADDGRVVSSSDYRGKDFILYFFPKANTPG
jgi:peroxiredoxin Q/BCP